MPSQEFGRPLRILEVGCGNGFNCSWIAQQFPDCSVTGIDYIPEMIDAARQRQAEDAIDDARLTYQVGNALELSNVTGPFDIVLTDRCLINLNSWDLQQQAYRVMAKLLGPKGYLATIENSAEARARQSDVATGRRLAGSPHRRLQYLHPGWPDRSARAGTRPHGDRGAEHQYAA